MKAIPPWSPKCLTFCHTLASQGQAISFSLAIGPDFSFSLDTRSKDQHSLGTKKKKQSPWTLRRNARRREEFAKKKQASSAEILADDEELVTAQVLKCDQCDYVGASEKGLKQHIRMKHKTSRKNSEIQQMLWNLWKHLQWRKSERSSQLNIHLTVVTVRKSLKVKLTLTHISWKWWMMKMIFSMLLFCALVVKEFSDPRTKTSSLSTLFDAV